MSDLIATQTQQNDLAGAVKEENDRLKISLPRREGRRTNLSLSAIFALLAKHWLLAAILVVGALLRLIGLRRQSLWTDELYVVWEGRQPLDVIFNPLLHYQHPPGYRLALHIWMGASTGETWIRLFPALAGIALIPVVWAISQALWPRRPLAADFAPLLVATSPFLLHYSQDATNYSWTILWVSVGALA